MYTKWIVKRLIGLMIFMSLVGVTGFVIYQAGVAQGGGGVGVVNSILSAIGAVGLSGLAVLIFMGILVFAFCPFRKRGRLNSQDYDS